MDLKQKNKYRQLAAFFLKLLVSAFLVFFLLRQINIKLIGITLVDIKWQFFSIAVVLQFLSLYISAAKWGRLLKLAGRVPSQAKLFALHLIGIFYSLILPGGTLAGEGVKLLKTKSFSENLSAVASSIAFEKITSLIAFIWLGLLSFTLSYPEFKSSVSVMLIFLILFGFTLLFFTLIRKKSHIQSFGSGLFNKIHSTISKLINLYRGEYKLIFSNILLGLIFSLVHIGIIVALSYSVNLSLPVLDLIWIYVLVNILMYVPITVLGIGLREISFVALLGELSVSAELSVSLSLALFASSLAPAIVGGILEFKDHFFTAKK